ncbi:putative NRPS-like protein biosynthetic cluster [Phanerochaete sordida]|uniref:NRPS-like protein biosynthetic cluster n=1 Tax=Phanerochaete sordida TaxID=48140 RepID=A0A9P3LLU9_9APHY|nr:putative NRPS-like protein biosynthetic cluster [Phanerochaete sordida]
MDSPLPPMNGTLPTLPDIADFHAEHNSSRPWLLFPSKDSSEQLTTLTYREMVDASHRIAHIMRPNREGPEGEVIALLLHTDTVLYVAVLLGLLRAGFVPYPMSPRNSPQGVCHMLESVACTRVLAQASTSALVHQVQGELHAKDVALRVDELPGLPEVFPQLCDGSEASAEVRPYPVSARLIDMRAPSLYVHSSGSTGYPKSVPFTYRRLLQWMASNVFGRSRDVLYAAMGLPTFHAMGLLLQLTYPLSVGREVVVYTPQYPEPPVVPHPQNVYEVSKLAGCTAMLALPSYVEAWSHSAEVIEYLKTLTVLIYGGGPLALSTGDKLVQAGVPLRNGYGGTEFGNPTMPWDQIPRTSSKPDPDWAWYRVPVDAPNIKWEPQGDGTYELVVYEIEGYDIAAYNIPGEKAYGTADLFEPHPTKPGLWKIVGRKDDVITLSTGEKIVPIPQEAYVTSSPFVYGCVMFGREREQPGILIEPRAEHVVDPSDENALVTFRNKIWPRVEEANALAPAFAKVFKEMIIVTTPDKPLPRAGKGTIIRKQALNAYSEEIDKLYETISASTNNDGITPPTSWKAVDLEQWLVDQAATLVSHGQSIAPTVDLFQQGFDSLSATFFRNRIIGALRSSDSSSVRQAAQNISSNIIFEHPTVEQLAIALSTLVDPSGGGDVPALVVHNRTDEIRAMIAKYTADIPASTTKRRAHESSVPPVVLLTGSTGNIGSHILAYLLAELRVARVYTLNRPSADPRGRLEDAFRERGLPVDVLEDTRLVSLVGDITRDRFGLEEAQYQEVLSSVTHVIHNAWTVNFNLALQSFEDQIAGVRKLVDISAASERSIQLLITSSIGIANAWDPAQGPVPERPLPNPEIAASIGYTASKYVVEHILDAARAKGVPATAVRMGQACGPRETGAWGTTEWMPIMTKSSVALGALPQMTGPIAWIPLDAVGQAYVDWVLATSELPALVNVTHPRPTSWDVVLRGLRQGLGDSLPIIPVRQWVARLEEHANSPTPEAMAEIPALKLVDFFRSLAESSKDGTLDGADQSFLDLVYDTSELLHSSPSMQQLQPMSEAHARAWVRYWKEKGFVV